VGPRLARTPLLALALHAAGCAAARSGPAPSGGELDAAPPAESAATAGASGADVGEAGPAAPPETGGETGGTRPCAALPLCDDFEGAAAGGPPDPTRWTVGAPDVTGTGALAIDDSQHHSGTRSVKVTGQGGYSNHIFFTNASVVGALGPVVWGRFYVRLTDALGDGHVTFLSMADAAAGGKHLRMGGQAKILMWNRESDDATLPALSPAGIAQSEPLPTGRWLCVELMVDEHAGTMQTWVDGVEVPGLHLDAVPTPDVDEQWLRQAGWRPMLTSFGLGWESYAGQPMTLWFDDVALDAQRVGCFF
jgi:hypothetical protein